MSVWTIDNIPLKFTPPSATFEFLLATEKYESAKFQFYLNVGKRPLFQEGV